jgi:predicted nucleic acid-binding protein
VNAAVVVLDASVGVKWFREEAGSQEAVELLRSHATREVRLAVPVVFLHEVLDVARRTGGVSAAHRVLDALARDEILVIGADAEFLRRALDVCGRLGCTVYDAAAPALAELLDAQLVSADRRAHGAFPGVRIIGS